MFIVFPFCTVLFEGKSVATWSPVKNLTVFSGNFGTVTLNEREDSPLHAPDDFSPYTLIFVVNA